MKKTISALLLAVLSLTGGAGQALHAQGTAAVVQQGDTAPGIDQTIFTASGLPAVNNSMRVAFRGTITGQSPDITALLLGYTSGIWANDGTGLQLAVMAGWDAPGTDGAVFWSFSDPVINNNCSVAFVGTLQSGVGDVVTQPVNNSIGIWSSYGPYADAAGNTQLVARQGDQAPGMATAVVFSTFNQIVLPDQGGSGNLGGVAFLATVVGNGIFSTNNQGIWAVDTNGVLQLIVCKGGRYHGKTITGLAFLTSATNETGQTRSFIQSTGDLVIKCTFSDSTWGIFRVVFPTQQSS